MKRKCLAIGIILLFLTIGFSPIINAQDNTKLIPIGTVPITVLEYRPDGTVERTVFRMSREQADSFYEEMRNAKDLDTRLSIYKKYNLISQDVTVDSLQAGLQEKAQRMGVSQDSLTSLMKNNKVILQPNVFRNIFCSISGWTLFPPIVIPFFRFNLVSTRPSFDAVDFIIGGLPIYSKGLLGEFDCQSYVLKMVGFVGVLYYFWRNFFGLELDGFCVYLKAIGIPD
jgi:hypothetical protein